MPIRTRRAAPPAPTALGRRVRALREARGLTQAQLAGHDFTKGFISLVETGRSSVSVRAAEIISGRLGVTVADLLGPPATKESAELELALLRAEQALGAGKPEEAMELARRAAPRASGLLRARLQRLHARALNQVARSREAIRLLDEALRQFRAHRQRELVARTVFDLAVAHGRLDQPGEALNLALECERAINAGEVVDRSFELQVLTYVGTLFVTLGDFGSADLRTERALAVAQDVGDPAALGALYAGLSVTREEQGDLEAALLYARRSLEMYERLGQASVVANTWNTIAWIYVQRAQYDRAAEALERARRMATEQRNGRLLAVVLQTGAELELGRGHHAEALRLAESSAKHPQASARARALSLLVRADALARMRAPPARLRAAFRDVLRASEAQPRRLRARAHTAYADALAARGNAKAAFAQARTALELLRPALG